MANDNEVIISGTAIDVPLDNYEEFDQDINPENLGAKLVQKNSLKGTLREFQLFANSYLQLNIVEKKNTAKKRYRINLAWISAEPVHNKIIIWKWLYLALTSGIATGLFMSPVAEQILKPEYCYIAATMTFTLTLIFSLTFMYCKRDEFIFKSHFGGANIFVIENKRPDTQAFDSFYLKIQQVIDKTQAELSIADRLVDELKMCRRLRDESIINDEAYTSARTAIFKHKEYKS